MKMSAVNQQNQKHYFNFFSITAFMIFCIRLRELGKYTSVFFKFSFDFFNTGQLVER